MTGTCRECRFWGPEEFGEEGHPFGACNVYDIWDADRSYPLKFRLDATFSDSAGLLITRDDFGCVEFQPKSA